MSLSLVNVLVAIALIERCGERLHQTHYSWSRTATSLHYHAARSGIACYQCQTFARIVLEEAGAIPAREPLFVGGVPS